MTKFNPTLSALLYSTFLGGSNSDYAAAMVLDAAGDVYLTGTATSTNFPVTPGAFQTTCSSLCFDAFVTELNPTGSALIYSTYLGGSITQGSGQGGSGIALDASGDAYVTGETGASDFPTTPGAFQTTCHGCVNGAASAFVTEFNPTGSALIYSTYLGGSSSEGASGITLDGAGDVYVAGATTSSDFPTTPGAFQTTCPACPGGANAFVTEFNSAGSALIYSTYFGGSSWASAARIALDAADGVYVVGSTSSTDFPVTPGAFQTACAGGCSYSDAFVTKFVPGDQVWPLSLSFGNQPVGIGSNPQNTVLTNSDTTTLSITSIKFTGTNNGDFSETDDCGTSVAAGASCNIAVTFTPTATGSRTASLTITDSATNSPQSVVLSGTGAVTVTVSPLSLNFGSQPLGTTSQALPVMLSTNGTLSISSIATSAPFAQTNNCGTGLAAGGSCIINVTFTPTAQGLQNGTLTISDDGTGSPQTVALSGTGSLAVTLLPSALTFSQAFGTTSQPMPVTLSTNGALTISSISTAAPFAQSNNCGTGLAAGGSCTVNVTFTPPVLGLQTGTLTVSDDAPGSPQTVSLSGTGVTPISLAPPSLNFGSQTVGITSPPLISTLTNVGTVSVTIASIVVTGTNSSVFAQMSNCPTIILPNGSCTISVTFTPTMLGSDSASVVITDNAPGSPQTVALTGTGNGPVLTLSPLSLTFSNQYVGTSGLPQSVTLTNTGSGALTITNVATSAADFGPLNACGSSVAVGSSCSIGVFFDPTTTGIRTGALTITDNASGSPQTVALSGTGQDFSMAPSGSSTATVSAGQTASYTVSVTPAGGFNQTVTFSCSGGPAGSACSVSPGSIKLNGSTSSTATVAVTTAGSSAGFTKPPGSPTNNLIALSLAFSGTLGLALLVPMSGRHRRWNPRVVCGLASVCILCMGLIVSGCGGGSSSGGGGTGTYNLTVTGNFTSGTTTLTHTTKLTLVVQ